MNNRNIGAKPLRTTGNLLPGKSILIFAAALAVSQLVSAQQASEQPSEQAAAAETREEQRSSDQATERDGPRKDYYRAELVILERRIAPDNINEQMASRIPEPPDPEISEILRVVDENGTSETTLDLVSRGELHLNSAANRLENSGRFRILLATGWYQSFPPDFEGEPLRVAIGDWLAEAGHRDVEGHITIDRQRYLHVDVHLNHWQPMPAEEKPADVGADDLDIAQPSDDGNAEGGEDGAESSTGDKEEVPVENVTETVDQPGQAPTSDVNRPRAELVTWIRETRRMRSEEVHFLDSPTIGVLVFFKKIEE
ncbi:CsiV family protein [Marinobacter orientalis]|uniref:5'-methylthioadenosine phosphorylase n=1 Tax=Marinobacter orientalis TaxID=1928859 RepID=A0A7Y0REC0_9GAMM|nr:CsiV family protein [Marinobacter orientalis]NMT64668.1 5'-methylthioadenosine phosphorylase [Marinobacter orientalis]TGX48297.1 5'-methylthioadenosine phosphorylase [Marinobacter orientalis]